MRMSLMMYGPANASSVGLVYGNCFVFLHRGGCMKEKIRRRGWFP